MQQSVISPEKSEKTYSEHSRIIFVHPEDWVREQFVPLLVRAEYKTVVHDSYETLPRAINIYKHSIVFFNVDKNPEGTTWYKLVKEFEGLFKQSRTLPVFIGKQTRDVITSKVHLDIPYDAFDMGKSPKQIFTLINALIKQWYDRGQRQFIRVSCTGKHSCRFNVRIDGDRVEGSLMDISSAGMACHFDKDNELTRLRKGSLLEKIQLKLGSRLVLVDGLVMGSREGEQGRIYVILFRNHSDTAAVVKIKEFVQRRLQEDFSDCIEDNPASS